MDGFSVAAERHISSTLANMRLATLDDAPAEIRKRLLKEADEITNKNVFGEGYKKVRGEPQEQGLGSFANPTAQSIEAYIKDQTQRRPGGPEAGYEANLKAMRARLAEVQAQRKALKENGDDDK